VVVSDESGPSILGFYSLSPASIDYDRSPAVVRRGLGHYEVPAYRLGRLAVDQARQGLGLGGNLIFAASRRCLRVASEIGGVALIIDAKNERVAAWYERYGAVPLLDTPLTLMIPFATLRETLRSVGIDIA
jgi:GNAT superfamily N-acetyltransferase